MDGNGERTIRWYQTHLDLDHHEILIQFDHHSSHWPALTLITYPEEGHTFRVRHGDMGRIGTCGTWGLGALGHGDMAFGAHGDIGRWGPNKPSKGSTKIDFPEMAGPIIIGTPAVLDGPFMRMFRRATARHGSRHCQLLQRSLKSLMSMFKQVRMTFDVGGGWFVLSTHPNPWKKFRTVKFGGVGGWSCPGYGHGV